MHVLRGGAANRRSAPWPERRLYDEAVREALIVLWEASDRVCGKRLKALAPILVEAMERHGHLQLAPEVRTRLLAMSAATMDRALRPVRAQAGGGTRRRTAPSSAVRRSVPVRTFADWHDPPPGFVEADLVAHSGSSASGSFVQTLVLTDIATGWTECGPLLVREQGLLSEVLTELRKLLPFDLLGFDTDNGQRVHERDRPRLLPGGWDRVHALPALSQERPSLRRAEERRCGASHRGLPTPGRMGGRGGPGPALRDGATVRELLPALVQAGQEGARGGTGPQALPSSGHAVRAAFGGPAHAEGGARPCGSPAHHFGSGSVVARDASGAAGARCPCRSGRRQARCGRHDIHRGVSGGAAHGLEGGGGQAHRATQAEAEARPGPAPPPRRRGGTAAGPGRRRPPADRAGAAPAGAR